MPDYISKGGRWKEVQNPQQARKEAAEEARKPRVFPAETKAVSKEKPEVTKIQVKPSKKASIFTPSKKGK